MNSAALLNHLQALVACDTQNPPRLIDGDAEIFSYCSRTVGAGFETRIWDHGEGHVSWFARRGSPAVLFNVHLDTVPNGEGWSSDPLELRISEGRAYGRGACDIKGAAAALLSLAEEGPDNMALLFTSDEEGAGGCCVSRFLETEESRSFHQVVVAEPTSCQAVLGHRGFLSVKTRFHGQPGHSSEPRALWDSANHKMSRGAAAALGVAEARKVHPEDPGSCLNLGIIDGGSKSNVIAGSAFVHWSARLEPGESSEGFLEEIKACADEASSVEWEVPFCGEPLPAAGRDDAQARAFCTRNGLMPGNPVDFWTEASVFSSAGYPAIVLGPGHIEQAHAADEWVEVEQLGTARELYAKVIRNDG